jgi:hypothetical protein
VRHAIQDRDAVRRRPLTKVIDARRSRLLKAVAHPKGSRKTTRLTANAVDHARNIEIGQTVVGIDISRTQRCLLA